MKSNSGILFDRPRRRDGGEREQHGQRDHRGGPGGPGGKPLKQQH